MSRAEVTLTQQKIKEELERRDYRQMDTKQSEYLKFQALVNLVCRSTTDEGRTLWVGRRGEIRRGRRLPARTVVSLVSVTSGLC